MKKHVTMLNGILFWNVTSFARDGEKKVVEVRKEREEPKKIIGSDHDDRDTYDHNDESEEIPKKTRDSKKKKVSFAPSIFFFPQGNFFYFFTCMEFSRPFIFVLIFF